MSFSDSTWRMWRDTPGFSQRFGAKVTPDQAEINGSWQKSVDGGTTWEHDFKVRYRRAAPQGHQRLIAAVAHKGFGNRRGRSCG